MRAGVPGFAAWVGIVVLGDPKPGSNVFISAASGAVGMSAGQLAKIRGCRVIGSTGSDEKVNFTEMLFFKKNFYYYYVHQHVHHGSSSFSCTENECYYLHYCI